jgi:hypothetical protein
MKIDQVFVETTHAGETDEPPAIAGLELVDCGGRRL